MGQRAFEGVAGKGKEVRGLKEGREDVGVNRAQQSTFRASDANRMVPA